MSSLLIWDVEAKTVGEILYYPPPPIRPASSQVTAILGHKWRPCLNLSTKLPPWQCFARRWLDQHLIRAHFGKGQCDVILLNLDKTQEWELTEYLWAWDQALNWWISEDYIVLFEFALLCCQERVSPWRATLQPQNKMPFPLVKLESYKYRG